MLWIISYKLIQLRTFIWILFCLPINNNKMIYLYANMCMNLVVFHYHNTSNIYTTHLWSVKEAMKIRPRETSFTSYINNSSNGLRMLLFFISSSVTVLSVSDLMFCYIVYLYFNIHVKHQSIFRENSNIFSIISVSSTTLLRVDIPRFLQNSLQLRMCRHELCTNMCKTSLPLSQS